jgi:hypothetical protein
MNDITGSRTAMNCCKTIQAVRGEPIMSWDEDGVRLVVAVIAVKI